MNTTEATKFLLKFDIAGARGASWPEPRDVLTALQLSGAAKSKAALRPQFTTKFQEICLGYDLAELSQGPILGSTSMRPTPTSLRDYTSNAALIAMSIGLQNTVQYFDALDHVVNSVDLSSHPIGFSVGLHINVWATALEIFQDHGMLVTSTSRKSVDDTMEALLMEVVNAIDVLAPISSIPAAAKAVTAAMISGTGVVKISSVEMLEPAEDYSTIDLKSGMGIYAILTRADMGFEPTDILAGIITLPSIAKDVAEAVVGLINIAKDQGNEIEEPKDEDISTLMLKACKYIGLKIRNPAEDSASEEGSSLSIDPGPSHVVPAALHSTINAILSSAALPSIDALIAEIDDGKKKFAEAETKLSKLTISSLRKTAMKIDPSGALPAGGATWENAYDILKRVGLAVPSSKKKLFNFDVPCFTWDSPHRDVPELDPDYRWRWNILAQLLWGLAYNKKPWIWGHTGTGKTTLIEQVAAILNWPFCRINFDSEITRMDLVGRDTLRTDEHGNTISHFAEGILPQAMQSPTIICNDELDFVRSDIAYVYQRALEDKGLLLTEDGGRLIVPHEYSRMVATANTQGQGDEFGLYQGARVQSQAFLDRFQCWIEVPYLDAASERKLIEAKVPALHSDMVTRVVNYVKEHREAFKQATILKPISPRGVVSLSEALLFFTKLHDPKDESKGVSLALATTILGSVTHADAAKINELIDRTFN